MEQLIHKTIKTLNFHKKRFFCTLRGLFFDLKPSNLEKPIFIIGCSRAGTTLVYKTFSESSELGSLNKETHDFWMELHPLIDRNWDTHSISADSANEHDRRLISSFFFRNTGKYRIVDKNNQNGLSVPYLYSLFPDAHFVYIKRNPGDNIDSLIHGWKRPAEFATWSDQIATTIEIEHGLFKRWCFFLANGWRQYTNSDIEEVCAFQYSAINRCILDARPLIPHAQWHEVFYEAILDNPVHEFQKLIESCGLSFDAKLRNHCENVLKNPYNTFSDIGIDKWKQGENVEKIAKVLPKIQALVNEMGY